MESAIRDIVSAFDANPMTASRKLRILFQSDPNAFVDAAIPVLREGAGSQGVTYLLMLLAGHGVLLKPLCDPHMFTFEQACGLARRLTLLDPRFDVRLLRSLLQDGGGTSPQDLERITGTPAGVRLLEILAEVSDGTRVLATMTQLLRHGNSHVRSKAALLVGRGNKSHKWVQERLGESDARVRANAVESLWGSDTAGARGVFFSALKDGDPRVVANAVLGLYRLGDPASVRLTLDLMSHPQAAFRGASLWVMGETGDQRFMPFVARLIGASEPPLRGNAFRAAAKLKKAIAKRQANPPLVIFAGAPRNAANGSLEFTAAVHCSRGNPAPDLNATNFAIWEDLALVGDYSVRRRGQNEPVAIAFAFPRIVQRGSAQQEVQDRAIERALQFKRRQDLWMILKYLTPAREKGLASASPGFTPADADLASAHMPFTADPEIVAAAAAAVLSRMNCACDPHQAIRVLIGAAAAAPGARNIVLICQAPGEIFSGNPGCEAEAAVAAQVSIHIISPWPNGAMYDLCSRTGGTLVPASSLEEIPEAVENLCAQLLNSYEVRYCPETPRASNLRVQVYTNTRMGEACHDLRSAIPPASVWTCDRTAEASPVRS